MRSIRGTGKALAGALLAAALLAGCRDAPKPKPAAPAAKAEPEIQRAQLYGRWVINSMNGGEIDRALVETHELEFAADQVRTHFVHGSSAPGTAAGGYFPWRLSGSTLTVINQSNGETRSARIAVDGKYLVIEPPNPFSAPKAFQESTVAYRRPAE
jgi:hypothetical protein